MASFAPVRHAVVRAGIYASTPASLADQLGLAYEPAGFVYTLDVPLNSLKPPG